MNENQIVTQALERVEVLTGLRGKWKPLNGEIDGEIEFNLKGQKIRFFVEVKKELRQYQLAQLIGQAKKHPPFMVVADHIFPTLKELLRQRKIAYLDTAGNIYVHIKNQLIWLDGNKQLEETKPVTNRAFTKTGLKTVFYLLLNPDALNLPYRQLAKNTLVALGNIYNVIEGMRDAGFLLQVDRKKLQLQNKKILLERWMAGFRETLKPALDLGKYHLWRKTEPGRWQDLAIKKGEDFWGGEPAAEILTHYLKPQILTLYTQRRKVLIMNQWKLIPDEKGNIELYEKFWADEQADQQNYTPPLLVYADLMLTDDPRCIETAGMIYNKYLKNEFE